MIFIAVKFLRFVTAEEGRDVGFVFRALNPGIFQADIQDAGGFTEAVRFELRSPIHPQGQRVAIWHPSPETAEVITSSAPCKSCNGTGIVALHYLPLLNSMKKTFTEVQRVAVQPIQRIEIDPADIPEELMGQEWNTDQWLLEHPEGEIDY